MNCCVYTWSPCLHFEPPLFTLRCSSRCLAKTLCQLHQLPSKVLQAFRSPGLSHSPLCLCDQFSRAPARFRICLTQLTQPLLDHNKIFLKAMVHATEENLLFSEVENSHRCCFLANNALLFYFQGNTFQLIVAITKSVSYAILLYPKDGLKFVHTSVGGQKKILESGFNQGLVRKWFLNLQGTYYRMTTDRDTSIWDLTK